MKNVTVIDHPVLKHKLGMLRDQKTSSAEFGRLTRDITVMLLHEATRNLETERKSIKTPIGASSVVKLIETPILVSILRAGNGMIDGAREVLPDAAIGHIGIYRDKAIGCTVEYFLRLPPNIEGRSAILLDPVIGTADTTVACVSRLKEIGVEEIKIATILASESGCKILCEKFPTVEIFAIGADDELTEEGFLYPGMGDVSARLYNYAE